MGFTVPNGPDAAAVDQSEPDSGDYAALGYRSTGVISGCAVAAQGSPNMSVVVAVGKVVVDGAPVSVAGGTVTIQTSDANPRFDLILANASGQLSALRGVASASNPVFPAFNPATHVLLAAVYLGASASLVSASAIVDKRATQELTFRRAFTSETSSFVEADSPTGRFTLRADGKLSWVESTLSRLSVSVMEMVASLTIRASDSAASVLTLKARNATPANQKTLDVQSAAGATVASVTGTGVLQAANFLRGSGSPEGVVTADKGSLYVDIEAPLNGALWMKADASDGDTGWMPFRSYDPTDDAIPVGTIAPFIGSGAFIPAGWIGLIGQMISTTDVETAELAAIVGSRYGSNPGVVGLPDFQGRIPIGTGGEVALTLGEVAGSIEITLTEAHLPSHLHPTEDPGHRHPNAGRGVYSTPNGNLHPTGEQNGTFALLLDPDNLDTTAETGVTVGHAGSDQPLEVLPPVVAVTWMVKARSTSAQANSGGTGGLWSIDELDSRYRPVVSTLPPASPFVGQIWILSPDYHSALLHPNGWVPIYPQTGNNAVTTGNAMLDLSGFWVATDGS